MQWKLFAWVALAALALSFGSADAQKRLPDRIPHDTYRAPPPAQPYKRDELIPEQHGPHIHKQHPDLSVPRQGPPPREYPRDRAEEYVTMEWSFQNNYAYQISVRIFTGYGEQISPTDGGSWLYPDTTRRVISFRCRQGTQVCYGAWSGNTYWGANFNGKTRCSSCCYTCRPEKVTTPAFVN